MAENSNIEVNTNAGGGLGLTTLLTIVFVVLKFTHVINWSWWWVLSPLWIGASIGLFFVIVILIIALIAYKSKKR